METEEAVQIIRDALEKAIERDDKDSAAKIEVALQFFTNADFRNALSGYLFHKATPRVSQVAFNYISRKDELSQILAVLANAIDGHRIAGIDSKVSKAMVEELERELGFEQASQALRCAEDDLLAWGRRMMDMMSAGTGYKMSRMLPFSRSQLEAAIASGHGSHLRVRICHMLAYPERRWHF